MALDSASGGDEDAETPEAVASTSTEPLSTAGRRWVANIEKPFRCPNASCSKAYRQLNGLKYHKLHGKCKDTSSRPDNDAEYPFRCHDVDSCGKTYRNANGLRYHYSHSGEHGRQGMEMLASGTHPPFLGRSRSYSMNATANTASRNTFIAYANERVAKNKRSRRRRRTLNGYADNDDIEEEDGDEDDSTAMDVFEADEEDREYAGDLVKEESRTDLTQGRASRSSNRYSRNLMHPEDGASTSTAPFTGSSRSSSRNFTPGMTPPSPEDVAFSMPLLEAVNYISKRDLSIAEDQHDTRILSPAPIGQRRPRFQPYSPSSNGGAAAPSWQRRASF